MKGEQVTDYQQRSAFVCFANLLVLQSTRVTEQMNGRTELQHPRPR